MAAIGFTAAQFADFMVERERELPPDAEGESEVLSAERFAPAVILVAVGVVVMRQVFGTGNVGHTLPAGATFVVFGLVFAVLAVALP